VSRRGGCSPRAGGAMMGVVEEYVERAGFRASTQ
jgi:hypothetical protein